LLLHTIKHLIKKGSFSKEQGNNNKKIKKKSKKSKKNQKNCAAILIPSNN